MVDLESGNRQFHGNFRAVFAQSHYLDARANDRPLARFEEMSQAPTMLFAHSRWNIHPRERHRREFPFGARLAQTLQQPFLALRRRHRQQCQLPLDVA